MVRGRSAASRSQRSQYSPSEIQGLTDNGNNNNINPIIDPEPIVGNNLYLAEAEHSRGMFAGQYIDEIRVLDDIEFRLRAGLIGAIGDARITKMGLTTVQIRAEESCVELLNRAVIDDFADRHPGPRHPEHAETSWSPGDSQTVDDARGHRIVDMYVPSLTARPFIACT